MKKLTLFLPLVAIMLTSCVTKKQYAALEIERDEYRERLSECTQAKSALNNDVGRLQGNLNTREEQITDLRAQIDDMKKQRDKQLEQVGDLTVLSQSASNNIKETLSQLERKDKYIQMLQAAKSKADSINLALAVNLKGVLKDGIEDKDVDIKVEKTVVYIDLSDKMLFESGSSKVTPRADEILGKIAQIVKSRPEVQVMVEGHTDNVPINNECVRDNWDLSVDRATSVVRILQDEHNIDPGRMVAAGRGEYANIASNDTADGRSTNRRTRIIILPKLNQFYNLLDPNQVPQ